MLTEVFIASTGVPAGNSLKSSAANKGLGIYLHELQPLPRVKSTFKKSNTRSNGIAVSASHIFAAQAEGAVVHVYDRERGCLEAVIPFSEAIECLVYAGNYDDAGVIALGTARGRLMLWEADMYWSYGTNSTITPEGNHLITSIVIGHGGGVANIAVSASLDKTCLVWDYHNGALLHTFLFGSAPLCIALDPVDRALYAGMRDGSIQLVDFYKTPHVLHSLWDTAIRATPTQPPASDRWSLSPDSRAAVQCLVSNYDGTVLLSGHDNGKIHTWDIAKGRYAAQLADFRCGVTNIHMIPPLNFPNPPRPSLILHHVMRPRFESTFPTDVSALASKVPEDYTFNVQFANTLTLSSIRTDPMLSFDAATHGSVLPDDIMREGLLACITATPSARGPGEVGTIFSEDYIDDNAATSVVKKELSRAVDAIQIYSEKVRALEGEIQRRDQDAKRRERLNKTQEEEMELLEHVRRQQEIGEIVDMNDREAMQIDRAGGNSQELKTI